MEYNDLKEMMEEMQMLRNELMEQELNNYKEEVIAHG